MATTTGRKTVNVEAVKGPINRALAVEADGNTPDYRRGLAAALETVLTASGNYRGFRYVLVPDDARDERGYLIDGRYDDTRREYF